VPDTAGRAGRLASSKRKTVRLLLTIHKGANL
jgi:hypothetical protein